MAVSDVRSSAATNAAKRELVITRVIDAPRERVFKAWIDPEQLAQWWGPKGFTNPVCELDARPGGHIRIDMRGPDGVVYPMKGVVHEIVEPERLVFTSSAFHDEAGKPQLEALNTVRFAEHNGKTKLTLRAVVVHSTPEVAGALAGMEPGWNQSLDRLGDLVAKNRSAMMLTMPSDRELVVTRIVDAPRELVFKAWTEPERLMRWFAPKGFTTPFCTVDLRVGGIFHYCMRSPEGRDIWGIGVYREIVRPERIVYTDTFANAEGNPVLPAHYGMSAGHPSETLVTVAFAEYEGKTKLTLRHSIPESVAERDATQQGWAEMFDRLQDAL